MDCVCCEDCIFAEVDGVNPLEAGMSVADTIRKKITDALEPESLTVEDESYRHAGHAGARPEGETHFNVSVVAKAFSGKSRVARQRMVYEILADEMAGPIHALALSTKAPGE